mgnify:CR=1 FL=1
MGFFEKLFGSYSDKELKRIQPILQSVLDLEEQYRALSDKELQAVTPALKARLAAGETTDDILPDAFAACREAADRVLGMRHFPVQVIGGIVLYQGRIAEMRTGEGKTLVATLPAYLNALTGEGVHIVTVNDYLAKRDSEWMGKIYRFMGLTVGLIINGMDSDQRHEAYNSDITYGTNNEFGFDYLRDNMVTYREQQVQRGHAFAIVDEVDSILIDEARTPLIISGAGTKSTDMYQRADDLAQRLKCLRVKEVDAKEDNDAVDADYIVDEKARTATLTTTGVAKVEKYFSIDNLTDPENSEIQHHINQAIKARGVMQRDVDYMVKDGQVLIVDEFTGRPMFGRRYNEGLHQAIEAKEGVQVQRESRTLATITFQNYFRMYKKLSGMTGTASTEADEFRQIYKLDVVEIPTNMPVIRDDHPDMVFTRENGKYNAVIQQILECHKKGQPVLVGTVSVEKSEHLSSLLKRQGVQHQVLNAKYHEKEAGIVAQAGKFSAVTIATNMAGRGTDIMLGGNAEFMAKSAMAQEGFSEEMIEAAIGYAETEDPEILAARARFAELYKQFKAQTAEEGEKVKAAGGLFIIGTERHESRRIDNQLRGRSGRQGDPGESRFYISLEDDLMRLFGGEKLQGMMDTLGVEEDMPIENKMLTGQIEAAQQRIEGRNFEMRKNVLQFDDVMNAQREIIYGQREQVLQGQDVTESIKNMITGSIDSNVERYLAGDEYHDDWNFDALRDHYLGWLTARSDYHFTPEQLSEQSRTAIADELKQRAADLYAKREAQFTPEIMRELERVVLLRTVDLHWMDHIDAMDELKRGIYLRGYAQRDPVVEYRVEGFDMFDEMIAEIREDTARAILTVQVKLQEGQPKREQVAKPDENTHGDGSIARTPVRAAKKIGRNDPCPCGSGKKYKKCCGRNA